VSDRRCVGAMHRNMSRGKPCPYCRREMQQYSLKLQPTWDHIVPRSRGGKKTRVCCAQCNTRAPPQDVPKLLNVFYCSDVAVQRFCEVEALDFNPRTGRSARDLFEAARARFTDARCLDIIIHVH
jgi:hypothetical protein